MYKVQVNSYFKTIDKYIVTGITTETDRDIIRFCDRNCFDGRVHRHGDGTAEVSCDID